MQLKTTGLSRIPGWFSVMKNKQQQEEKKPSLQPPSYYQVPKQSAAEAASLSLQVSSLEGQLCSLTACAQTMAQLLILWPDSVLCFHIMPPINDRSDTLHTLTHSLWLQRAGRIGNVCPLLQNTTGNIWNIRERITSEKWCCSSVTDLMETCQLLHAAEDDRKWLIKKKKGNQRSTLLNINTRRWGSAPWIADEVRRTNRNEDKSTF